MIILLFIQRKISIYSAMGELKFPKEPRNFPNSFCIERSEFSFSLSVYLL